MEALVEGAAPEESVVEIVEVPDSDVDADDMIEEFMPAEDPVETDVANVDGVDVADVIDPPKPPSK